MSNPTLIFLPFLAIMVILMVMNSRRQKRQVQKTQKMQSALSDGDVVYTTSGVRGTVVDSSYEETIDIELAPGVVTTWLRQAVRETVTSRDESTEPNEPASTASSSAVGSSSDADARSESRPDVDTEQNSGGESPVDTPTGDSAGRGAS